MNKNGVNSQRDEIMTSDRQTPILLDGAPPTEIVIPVVAEYQYERDIAIGAGFAALWQLPLRLVHVRVAGSGSNADALDVSVDALRKANGDLVVEGIEVAADDAASGIQQASTDQSLLLMASDDATQWFAQDSIGEAMLQQVKHMVLLCGPGCQNMPKPAPVVVPLDGSPRAESALDPAIAVATASKATIRLVTAVPPATVEAVARLRDAGEHASESAYLRSVATRLAEQGIDVGWEVVHHGDPVAGISTIARDLDAMLIVAASRGETGITKWAFGSVPLGLVERSSVPVLVVKTDLESAGRLETGES